MSPPPRDSRRLVPAYLATAGRARPSRNTLDRLTVLYAPASASDRPDHPERADRNDRPGGLPTRPGRSGRPVRPGRAGRPGQRERSPDPQAGTEGPTLGGLRPEEQRLLDLLHPGALTLAEAAAHLRLPVSVLRVIAADLIDAGHLRARAPIPDAELPQRQILEKVLNGLRTLKSS